MVIEHLNEGSAVYLLEHMKNAHDYDSVKTLGIYTSLRDAEEAVARYKLLNGFRDYPDGFSIDKYALGKDHWTEGFS